MQSKPEETFYDIIKVDRKATIAEIVNAYHAAKNAFSRDSVATYSLFSPEEAKGILDKLDEAYHTLSNIDKKREYDRVLLEKEGGPMPNLSELERKQNANIFSKEKPSADTSSKDDKKLKKDGKSTTAPEPSPVPLSTEDVVSGNFLKNLREKRSLSIEDVARVTKIPAKFIRAIETEDANELPVRVYLQGFVKNLASLYKLDPKIAVASYLAYTDQKLGVVPEV